MITDGNFWKEISHNWPLSEKAFNKGILYFYFTIKERHKWAYSINLGNPLIKIKPPADWEGSWWFY